MITIRTTQDIIQALETNREFREAARRLLLSQELLDMPDRLARLTDTVEAFITEQQQFNHRIETRLDRMDTRFDRMDTRLDGMDARFDRMDARLDGMDARFDGIDARLQKLNTDIGELRGNVARQVVGTQFRELAQDMGFQYQRMLYRDELVEMCAQVGPEDIARGDRRSFYRADLVLEVTDSAEATHYLAVEASYTGDERDTQRAQRNAALLTRFLGCPAHPAIASVRNIHEIQDLIDDGTVHWYPLEPADFTPD